MITIQGDGHIAGRSDHVRDASFLGTPNTLWISRIRKQSQGSAHSEKPSKLEILRETGAKTPLSPSTYVEKENASLMQVLQILKSCLNSFYIAVYYISDPILPLTSIIKTTLFFFYNEGIGQPKNEPNLVRLNWKERRKKKKSWTCWQKRWTKTVLLKEIKRSQKSWIWAN